MPKITLKAARVNAGLSQREAAHRLKVSRDTVINWENGKSVPRISKVEPICMLYGVMYDDISWIG